MKNSHLDKMTKYFKENNDYFEKLPVIKDLFLAHKSATIFISLK